MGNDFELSEEDIKVFLDETEEQLQVMESGFLALEKEGADPEQLQAIFRAAHTLKGSSATLGHKKMAEVTHAMENVLDKLRKGQLAVSSDLVDTLFASLDVLNTFRDEIASGEEKGVEIGEILARLSAVDAAAQTEAAQSGTAAAGPGTPPQEAADQEAGGASGLPPLEPQEAARVAEGCRQGQKPFFCTLTISPDAVMPSVRAFQALLAIGDLGELIRSWPSQGEVEADQVKDRLEALFLTSSSLDEVRTALAGVPDIAVARLEEVKLPASSPEAVSRLKDEGSAEKSQTPNASAAGDGGGSANGGGFGSGNGNGSGGSRGSGKHARTVRVDVELLDNLMNLVGELVIDRTRLYQVLTRLEAERDNDELTQMMSSALAHISRMTGALQDEIQRARMLPVENLFRKFPRMVRDLAHKLGRELELEVRGEETELDRSVIEEIGDPLMHLLRNAVDHGIEPPEERERLGKPRKGRVVVEASHEENHIIIRIQDDGRGIDADKIRASAVSKGLLSEEAARRMPDPEVMNLIWSPGFSTAKQVTDISGRGVGLDVVHKNIEKLNGSVEIRTEPGKGTEFRVKLPLTLAIIRALQVVVQGAVYCIPLNSVVETDRISTSQIQTIRQREVIVKRGEVIPLLRLSELFEAPHPPGWVEPEELCLVIASVMGRQAGIVVDDLLGEGDVVIKPLGKFIGDIPGIAGATIMGDGDVAIILDVPGLVESAKGAACRLDARA